MVQIFKSINITLLVKCNTCHMYARVRNSQDQYKVLSI